MSLHLRIIALAALIFAVPFTVFVVLVTGLPRTLGIEIDAELQVIQENILNDAEARGSIELQDLRWPDEMSPFQSGSSFYVVLNEAGEVVGHSDNISAEHGPLDPELSSSEIKRSSQTFDEQSIRVLSYPIVGQFSDGDRLIGHLQVARLINDFAFYQRISRSMLFAGLSGLFLSIVLLVIVIPSALRPLDKIVATTATITSADDLNTRIPDPGGRGTVVRLIRSFNQLFGRLEDLFRTQQRLLGDVSHELRTPLTAIRGNVDLIRRMGEADGESLDAIEIEVERMTRLVNDLLTLARAEVGGLPIQKELVDLDMVFLHIYEQVTLIGHPVRVILRDVSQALVLGDKDRLSQLMLNLLTNAIKYTDEGGSVWVSLTTTETMAVYTVEDTGIGIPSENLTQIFERFYRVDKARARGSGGTARGGAGLGLAIANSIIEAHDGDITVESEVGVGSTFTVTIPLYKLPEPETESA